MINACVTKYNKNTSKDNSLFFIQDWSTGAHAFYNSEQKSHCSTEPVFLRLQIYKRKSSLFPSVCTCLTMQFFQTHLRVFLSNQET